MLAAVTLIAEGISYFSAETVDTKEGLAIIKAAEKENVKDIEKKINKLDTKDKLESQEASGEINYKSLFSSSVVMGDSISEAFTEYDLLNASSVVAKIGVELDELDDQIKTVADINPQVIFLSYGMNDVIATNGDTDLFIKEYKAVIDQLRKKLPDTTLYVNSIFPVSAAKQEEKPVFAVVEPAVVPLKPSGISKKVYVLVFIFLSVCIVMFWKLFGEEFLDKIKEIRA